MPPTDRRKGGAERVPFGGEGSSSIPSPVKEIKFEKRGRAQEQSSRCVSHVTPVLYFVLYFTRLSMLRQCDDEKSPLPSDSDNVTPPTDRRKCGAERFSFSGGGSSSVISPVKERSWDGLRSRALCAQPI